MIRPLLALGLLLTTPALAQKAPGQWQMACAPHEVVLKALTETLGERAVWAGASNHGYLMSLWQGAEGAYTVMVTFPNGTMCALDSGHELDIKDVPFLFPGTDM